jgi:hypothetical protein
MGPCMCSAVGAAGVSIDGMSSSDGLCASARRGKRALTRPQTLSALGRAAGLFFFYGAAWLAVFPCPLFLNFFLLIKSAYMLGPAQALDTRRRVHVGEPSEARSSAPGVRPSLSLGEIESSRDPSDHAPAQRVSGVGRGAARDSFFFYRSDLAGNSWSWWIAAKLSDLANLERSIRRKQSRVRL